MPLLRVILRQRRRLALHSLCVMALAAWVRPAEAQFTLRGTVFDSIAGKPLAGAEVQVAPLGAASAPRTTTTDALGRYTLTGLPAAEYSVGFYHDALTALGLDVVTRRVVLSADSPTTVDLAVPSSATVRALRCGESSAYAPGMLVGSVRDAATRAPIAGSVVAISWSAIALDAGNYRTVTDRATVTVDDDGSYLACHLPLDAPLRLLVRAVGHRTIDGPVVTVPANGIARLDVQLVDSATVSGAAVVRGRVLRESGKTVASGRVVISALGLDVPVQDGAFAVGNVPAGTWVAEARVIGVEPQAMLVQASDSAVATATFTVSNHSQRLDAVTVVGKPSRDLRVLDEVLRRSRIGSGTTFLPGHPALRSAVWVTDVMKEARGFRYVSQDSVTARATTGGVCKSVAVFVNDVPQSDMMRGIDLVAPVSEVLAVETWPDITFAPVQYRYASLGAAARRPCALVLIWTRRGF